MLNFDVSELLAERAASEQHYHEFLRVPSMSVGVYHLPAGSEDPQSPHTEDEVYYVIDGSATIRVGGVDRKVAPGSIIFVAAQVPHKFHSIKEDLTVLVFFAPAETQADAPR